MELQPLVPDLPQLLVEMGVRYDPDKLAAQLSSRWPQVRVCRDSEGRCWWCTATPRQQQRLLHIPHSCACVCVGAVAWPASRVVW
jgi:hypothetical protein